ncbi:MAG: flagellar basal body-associated FliL family protein [Phenylobacterium sp.]|uniref:flagellar basal body-associated FliL family protein n=1 Tax=Phenylobacterium sp. TaxID=1871053 RepID=UPI003BB7966B
MAKDKVKEAPAGDAAEGEDGEGASGKKKLPMKMIIIGAVAAVLVLGGGGTAAMILLKPKPDEAHGKADEHGKEKKKEKKGEKGHEAKTIGTIAEGPDGVLFYTMPNVVVNMQTADGRATFLKLKLTLEVPDQETVDLLEPNMPRLQDMFQTFLRELRPEDLQGSQGSYQLRMEILRRVNLVIAPSKVNAVLIEEMLIN